MMSPTKSLFCRQPRRHLKTPGNVRVTFENVDKLSVDAESDKLVDKATNADSASTSRLPDDQLVDHNSPRAKVGSALPPHAHPRVLQDIAQLPLLPDRVATRTGLFGLR